jgi:hypothetical protein
MPLRKASKIRIYVKDVKVNGNSTNRYSLAAPCSGRAFILAFDSIYLVVSTDGNK